MPERTERCAVPAVASDRPASRFLVAHVQFGRALLERLGTHPDDETERAYRAWQDRSRELVRFVLIANEMYETHVRSVYRRMCLRHLNLTPASDACGAIETDLRDLEWIAHALGPGEPDREPAPSPVVEPGADGGKVLVVYGRNHEVREQVAR